MTTVVAKVMHQTEKVKGKWQERKRRGEAARSVKTLARPASRLTQGRPGDRRRAGQRASVTRTGNRPRHAVPEPTRSPRAALNYAPV